MLSGHSLGGISHKMAKPRLLVFQSSLLTGAGIFYSMKLFLVFFLFVLFLIIFYCFNNKSDF